MGILTYCGSSRTHLCYNLIVAIIVIGFLEPIHDQIVVTCSSFACVLNIVTDSSNVLGAKLW
jgi:hypothetical protein